MPRSISSVPNPRLASAPTLGPPCSVQISSRCGGEPAAIFQLMSTRPPATDKAPYLAALVASSCMTSAISNAACGFSITGGPSTLRLALPAARCGASSIRITSRNRASRPAAFREQVVGVPESVNPADQLGFVVAIRQGALGERRDHRQRVLDAVAELGGQHLLLRFGRHEIGHVHKRQQHAVDRPVGRAIRQQTRQIMLASFAQADRALDHLAVEHGANVVFKIRVGNAAGEIGQRPPLVPRK